eukprot:XP_011436176.1 PREDICTED: uncharacterized protein LOC105334433 [Crassostrea gigas]
MYFSAHIPLMYVNNAEFSKRMKLMFFVLQLLTGYGMSSECNSHGRQCCSNYFMKNGHCSECPAGTYGDNCNVTCPDNYFGRFCEEECHCSYSQYCDSVNGCLNITTNTTKITETSEWKNVTLASIGSIITIGLAAAGVISLRSRWKKCQVQPSSRYFSKHQREDNIANQNIEAAAFERCASKGASENLHHPYGNLRFMHSMDTTTENKTTMRCVNDEISNDNNVGVNYGLISKRQLKDACFSDTNREGRLSNNYEQPFQPSSEYSILSLKRKIDLSTTDLYV